jgi:uncharacterized membrane protein (UPF0127 family)
VIPGGAGSRNSDAFVNQLPDAGGAEPNVLRVGNLTRGSELAGRVELADSFGARFRGLMGRAPLVPGSGMWLTGTSNIHMFFMRFPIDAIFVGRPAADGTRRVVAVHANLRPWTGIVWYARGADGCLELPAGTAKATGTRPGDVVILELVV